jgi:hypothetical protein
MIVAELFAKEHALFRAFIDRLEVDLAQRRDKARADLSDALRILLPSLDRHAEIEDIVFQYPPDGVDDDPKALAEVAAQHHTLAALRNEILFALERSTEEFPFAKLSTLTQSLIKGLRVHLATEETRLWPLYQAALARPVDAVVPIHLDKRARILEKQLSLGIAAIPHSASLDSEKS